MGLKKRDTVIDEAKKNVSNEDCDVKLKMRQTCKTCQNEKTLNNDPNEKRLPMKDNFMKKDRKESGDSKKKETPGHDREYVALALTSISDQLRDRIKVSGAIDAKKKMLQEMKDNLDGKSSKQQIGVKREELNYFKIESQRLNGKKFKCEEEKKLNKEEIDILTMSLRAIRILESAVTGLKEENVQLQDEVTLQVKLGRSMESKVFDGQQIIKALEEENRSLSKEIQEEERKRKDLESLLLNAKNVNRALKGKIIENKKLLDEIEADLKDMSKGEAKQNERLAAVCCVL